MTVFEKTANLPRCIINSLEDSQAPFMYFILTFFSAVTLRNFIEAFSCNRIIQLSSLAHAYFYFVALAMSLILLFRILTKEDVVRICKVVLPSFIILNIAPLLDLMLSAGRGYRMAYIGDSLLLNFLTFFGASSASGITPGMKVEILLALLGSFIYFYLKNSNLIRSIVYTLLTYTLIFSYQSMPLLVRIITKPFILNLQTPNSFAICLYATIALSTGAFLASFKYKELLKVLITNIRPFRLIHFQLMFVLGVAFGTSNLEYHITYTSIFHFVFIPTSITFAWLYSVVTNNIADYEIDKILNREMPPTDSGISAEAYEKASWLLLFMALLFATIIGFQALFVIALFIGNYFLYSMPPFRLKRITLFSKVLISLNSLLLVMLGFGTVGGQILQFPRTVIALFLIGFTLVINFIDIKDYEGDKKAGIKTLPVVLGLRKAKVTIGLFFVLTYCSAYFVAHELLIPSVVVGLVELCLINKKNYNERHIFSVYILSLMVAIAYIFLFKIQIA